MTMEVVGNWWAPQTLLAMLAIFCLPRQFQVTVVENVDESHLNKALWLFPLYLLLINVFVLPIAFGGLLRFPLGTIDADTYVLALPLAEGAPGLALFAFIGGLSAATGMVIVASVALSTMICNDLVMPVLLRFAWLHLSERRDLSGLLLAIRRGAIGFILLIGYLYFLLIGESYALVSIGLVSFAAAAQFAPAILAGMYWKGASHRGALVGISGGFLVWGYTLMLPSFALSGWLPGAFVEQGPLGIALLKPYALFGLDGLDHISHAVFWSLLVNAGALVGVSLVDRQSMIERIQATLFVEVFRQGGTAGAGASIWQGSVSVADLWSMAERFLGSERTGEVFAEYARQKTIELDMAGNANGELVQFVERRLAGVIGAASARVMVASTLKGEGVGLEELMQILDETSQVLEYSRQLEHKSAELEQASAELKAANERLARAKLLGAGDVLVELDQRRIDLAVDLLSRAFGRRLRGAGGETAAACGDHESASRPGGHEGLLLLDCSCLWAGLFTRFCGSLITCRCAPPSGHNISSRFSCHPPPSTRAARGAK
jgi:hypothetical protein